MIARHWRGWTKTHNADAYEALLRDRILPGLKSIPGCEGGYLLRSDGFEEVEFVVLNFFESIEAVKLFAGPDYAMAVFEPDARQLLSRVEPTASHYEVRMETVTWPSRQEVAVLSSRTREAPMELSDRDGEC